MACQYFVNGEWITESQFKQILNNGLLDNLVNDGKIDLPGFTPDTSKLATQTEDIVRNSIPAKELREILIREIKSREGYPLNMIDALELSDDRKSFKIPLWTSNYVDKFEALLTSMVSNKIIKHKFSGHSYVLGSEEGFKVKIKEGEDVEETNKKIAELGIVTTSNYDPKKGLQPLRYDKSKNVLLPAQIMIPFRFRDNFGKFLNVEDFMTVDENGRKLLDTTKIPDKVLKLFGFRIPTQGHNSMSLVEIVGFLPDVSGDLLFAPRDFTKQMGSDFDVDKLYTYMYNNFYKDGKIHTDFESDLKEIKTKIEEITKEITEDKLLLKATPEEKELFEKYKLKIEIEQDNVFDSQLFDELSSIFENAKQETIENLATNIAEIARLKRSYESHLQNKLLDIHDSVMSNPNEDVVRAITSTDGFGEMPELAKRITAVQETVSILSETYQRQKYINANAGKMGCLGLGTKVLMYNGSFEEVQNIKKGDLLMGIDSTPRKVLELKRGREQMYFVEQNRGINYRVNESHIISLKQTFAAQYHQPSKNKIRTIDKSIVLKEKRIETVNISVRDYLKTSSTFKRNTKGYKCSLLNFETKKLLINPYYLGLWLGDGVTKDITEIATIDPPIEQWLKNNYGIKSMYGPKNISKRLSCVKLSNDFKQIFNVTKKGLPPGGKFIPNDYIFNSKENRLLLLAGLIDSDGHYCKINKQYRFTNINKKMIDQIIFLIRSLGFYASLSERKARISKRGLNEQNCYTINFVADCDIPVLLDRKKRLKNSNFKNRLHTGFTLRKDIVDDYYGFVLDKDHLFLLEDLTVTHNTGVFSLDSTFAAAVQGLNIVYSTLDSLQTSEALKKGGTKLLKSLNGTIFKFGELSTTGDISDKKTLSGTKLKSKIIQYLQSTAVDNEKEQLMDKLNINDDTFDAIRSLALFGFEEKDIFGLINQPIVIEYLERLKTTRSSLVEYVANAEDIIYNTILEKYDPSLSKDLLNEKQIEQLRDISGEDLFKLIESGEKADPSTGDNFITPDKNLQQLLLLDKFLKATEVGKEIKKLQSTINSTKGLPKNLIEVTSKVEQVQNIGTSRFVNADLLLGTFDDLGNLQTPTTINGFATFYGTMFANDMFNEFFPYNSDAFSQLTTEIKIHTNLEEASVSKQTELKRDVFKAVRSYLLSSSETGLFKDIATKERFRLFMDVKATEKKPANKSLASILKTFEKEKWFQTNSFLNSISLDINTNGDLSRVYFESSQGDNMDESKIYLDFIGLFTNTSEIGTFNGRTYTRSMLAQDLVAYAYLEGGNQSAKQFLKYIPVNYLKLTSMNKYFESLQMQYEEFGGSSEGIDFFNPSSFTRQYFQNNPGKATTLIFDDIVKGSFKSIKDVETFELTPKGFTKHNVEILKNGVTIKTPPKFVSFYDADVKGKYALFEFDESDRKYHRIAVVSDDYGFSQYDKSKKVVQAIQTKRRATNKISGTTLAEKQYEQGLKPTKNFEPNTLNNNNPINMIGGIEIKEGLSDEMLMRDMLRQITQNPIVEDSIKILANKLMTFKFPSKFKLVFIDEEGAGKGAYKYDTQTLTLNKYNANTISTSNNILHELIHTFSGDLVYAFENPNNNLTQEQKEAVQNLKNIQARLIAELDKQGLKEQREEFARAYWVWKNFKDKKSNIAPTQKELDTIKNKENQSNFYATIKTTELITMALTDRGTQNLLNSITDSKTGTSIWESLTNAILEILNSLGLNINKNSLLADTIKNSLLLVDSTQVEQLKDVATTSSNLFTAKIDQFTYTYNPTTNEVIHNAKAGDKVETNDTQINKVLVQYALANSYEQRTFNGFTYVAIADRVLNIKNSNEVSPETWESAKSITVEQPSTSSNKYELFPGVFANQGQTEAIDLLNEFLDSDKSVFLLQGKGGTGKTTIIKKVLSELKGKRILAVAPSHKAKKVLGKSIEKEVTADVRTLQSALAIKLDETTGKFSPDTYARNQGRVPILKADVIVIDESSMVTDALLEEIRTLAPKGAKIIFMGDRAQLPPVGQETDSNVFNLKNGYELKEKMRQAKTSPIINIGTIVSENVETDGQRVANPITPEMRVNSIDPISNSSVVWESSENTALKSFVEDIKQANGDVNFAKIVTFNNQNHNSPQSVKNLNNRVRHLLFGEQANSQQFISGEILTTYDTFTIGEDTIFNNSEDLIVVDSTKVENKTFNVSAFSQQKGARNVTLTFDVEYLTVKNEDGKVLGTKIPVIADSSKQAYQNELSKLFKTDAQLAYKLTELFGNVEYGYAITAHKAQGSTYTNVYVMEDNIMGSSNGSNTKAKNQALYVAVSRPTTKLVMVSSKNDPSNIGKSSTPTQSSLEDLFKRPDASDIFSNDPNVYIPPSENKDSFSQEDMDAYNNLGDLFGKDESLPDLDNMNNWSNFVQKVNEYKLNCK